MTGSSGLFRVRHRGYDMEQVDRLVNRITSTLGGDTVDPVTVIELQYRVYFDIKMRGYDRAQVDAYVAESVNALRRYAVWGTADAA